MANEGVGARSPSFPVKHLLKLEPQYGIEVKQRESEKCPDTSGTQTLGLQVQVLTKFMHHQ